MIQIVETENAASALGHYSQATILNGTIYTATQLPIDPSNAEAPKGDIESQARIVLNNLINIVRAGGGDINTIARVMVYVSDAKHWEKINKIYEEIMGDNKPARGVLEIPNLRKGYDVSMDAIAGVK